MNGALLLESLLSWCSVAIIEIIKIYIICPTSFHRIILISTVTLSIGAISVRITIRVTLTFFIYTTSSVKLLRIWAIVGTLKMCLWLRFLHSSIILNTANWSERLTCLRKEYLSHRDKSNNNGCDCLIFHSNQVCHFIIKLIIQSLESC